MKTEKIPIVFVQVSDPLYFGSDSSYFKYVITQAKIFNPDTTIYLIGDEFNDNYDFVTHCNIKDYSFQADNFSKLYKHHGKPEQYGGIFCFKRWFIIKEFMAHHNIDKCLCLDSDLLLFTDIQEEHVKYRDCVFTLAGGFCPHFNIINNVGILNEFCDFVLESFKSEPLYRRLIATADEQPWSQGWVSDMVAFYEYQKQSPNKIGDISLIVGQTKHDASMLVSEGFEKAGNIKKVIWIDNIPYCRDISSGSLIRFKSLHFQGPSKEFIKYHFKSLLQYSKDKQKWSILDNQIRKNILKAIGKIRELSESEEFEKAGASFKQLIEKYPDVTNLLDVKDEIIRLMHAKGEIMSQTGNSEEASKIFSDALELELCYVEALNNLAATFFHTKKYNDAIRIFQKVLRLSPGNQKAMENLNFIQNEMLAGQARSLIQKGLYHEAEPMLEMILTSDEQHIEALNLFSAIYIKKGEIEEARKKIFLLLQLDPDNREGKKNLEYLNQQKANYS
jgi:Flp pilus assembly protein TadD